MKETNIQVLLETIKNVQNFVKYVNLIEDEILIKSHRYIIDAKSIMGIFSLNLLEPINIVLQSDNDETIKNFKSEMEKYKVKEDL